MKNNRLEEIIITSIFLGVSVSFLIFGIRLLEINPTDLFGRTLIILASTGLGITVTRFYIYRDKNSLLSILERSLIFDSNDKESIKPYRIKLHYYWVSDYEDDIQWHYSVLDFSNTHSVSKLVCLKKNTHPDKKIKKKATYYVEAFMRQSRLIIITSPEFGSEQPVVSVIPYVNQDHGIDMAGVAFLNTWSYKDFISPVYISTNKEFNINEGVITDTKITKKLYDLWENKMKRHTIHFRKN